MIKGLVITPPVVGRISIGRVVEKNGKRLPEKDDQFTITTQVQGKDGWINHPLDAELRQGSDNGKLRVIPVRFLFNEPDLNLRAEYTLFDRRSGRPVCVGNGETCRRSFDNEVQTLPCPSPEGCELAKGGYCKPYGRLNVQIGEEDQLGTFIFRTTGFNSIRSLTARLNYYRAVSRNLLSCLPLALRIRGKSTAMSFNMPIYYVDITTREGMSLEEAIHQAQALAQQRRDTGYDQSALDQAAREGFGNGAFEETVEEASEIMDEFFPPLHDDLEAKDTAKSQDKPSLTNKLNRKTQSLTRTGI